MILDGVKIANEIKLEIKAEIKKINATPKLAVVLCSEDSASEIYVKMKQRTCAEIGIESFVVKPSPEEVPDVINSLNFDKKVNGILIQLPLHKSLNQYEILEKINPLKDVDVLHPYNVGLLSQGRPRFVPCTPAGIQELLIRSGIELKGKKVVIINRSEIVGKPLNSLLIQNNACANATVTLCHDHTPPKLLRKICISSDIIVVAVGIPDFLNKKMVTKKTIVVDVGINRLKDKLVGDANPEIYNKIYAYSPVPGGVGPLTVAQLMRNTLESFKLQML